MDGKSVYAIVLKYPEPNKIDLYSIREIVGEQTKVKLLGYEKEIKVSRSDIVNVNESEGKSVPLLCRWPNRISS